MIAALGRWWRQHQRNTDLRILWPVCKEHCDDMDKARAVFFFHTDHDLAWTTDLDVSQRIAIIDALT